MRPGPRSLLFILGGLIPTVVVSDIVLPCLSSPQAMSKVLKYVQCGGPLSDEFERKERREWGNLEEMELVDSLLLHQDKTRPDKTKQWKGESRCVMKQH